MKSTQNAAVLDDSSFLHEGDPAHDSIVRLVTTNDDPGVPSMPERSLSSMTAEELERWFSDMADGDPGRLAGLIGDRSLTPDLLAIAARCAGRVKDDALVREALLPLLQHTHTSVRLQAVEGLVGRRDGRVRAAMRWLLLEEPDAAVRERAGGIVTEPPPPSDAGE